MFDKYLSKTEIDDLDERIDSIIENFQFLSKPRDQALFHILLAYTTFADNMDVAVDPQAKHNTFRNLYHGLNHTVQWIYSRCPLTAPDGKTTFDHDLLLQAMELLTQAGNYSGLWTMMILLYKNRARAKSITADDFEISSANFYNRDLDTARMIMSHADDQLELEDISLVSRNLAMYIKSKLKINRRKTEEDLQYSLRRDDFTRLTDEIIRRNRTPLIMNPDWDLGGYTYRQLRLFWVNLQALCIVHKIAGEIIYPELTDDSLDGFYTSRLKTQSLETWIAELTNKTRLPEHIVKLIIDDLTQDEGLYVQKDKKTHVMYQPFFHFADNRLAVCERIVISSNIERNAWSLMSIIRPKLFSRLTKEKESFWIEEFKAKVSSLGLKSFSNLKFKDINGKGEIDLLIMDENLKFALVCELKWLTSSDTASGVNYDDNQIMEGIGQATKAVKWIYSNFDSLSQKIGYDKEELKNFEVKPLVIGKESIGSGFIDQTDVPVIDNNLFDWITFSPRKENIRTLWNIARSLSYLPKLNEHYVSESHEIEWGEMKFYLKDMGFKVIKRWKPENDIYLPE